MTLATDRVSLVILDMDGTLVDSQALIIRNMQAAADIIGLPIPAPESVTRIIGLSLEQAVARIFPDTDPSQRDAVAKAYREERLRLRAEGKEDESLFPGIRTMIERLRDDGHTLGIATGKARRGVDHFCERFDMIGWFQTVQTPDTNPSKPHPGMIESALAETGACSEHAVMVGDTIFDMEMAQNAGIPGIGVTWGNHSVDMLERAGARHIVETADDLPQVVAKILKEGAHS